MAKYKYEVVLEMKDLDVKEFIIKKENWVSCFPQYKNFKKIDENEIQLVFEGDFGIIKKDVILNIKEKEVQGKRIKYEISSESDPIKGEGNFEIIRRGDRSNLTFELFLIAEGFVGSMMNPILEKSVPYYTSQLLENIKKKI